MKKVILTIAAVIIFVGFGWYLVSKEGKPVVTNNFASVPADQQLLANMQKTGLDPLTTEGTVMHIHQHLDIIINGQNMAIPADIGVGSNFISAVHTHDDTGVLHVESPVQKDYTLGQFFDEWGVTLSDTCVANFCDDSSHKLVVGVNGKAVTSNVRDTVLHEHDEITVWYGPSNQTPDLKASYNFSPGL